MQKTGVCWCASKSGLEGIMRRFCGFALVILAVSVCWADRLVLTDGSTHEGTLVSATSRSISFRESGVVHRYARSRIQNLEFTGSGGVTNTAASERLDSGATPSGRNTMTLPTGTQITVLTNQDIDSSSANSGQTFPADVAENVTNSAGQVVIPKGSEAELVIRDVSKGGTVSGPQVALDLQSLKVNGRRYMVSTEDVQQSGEGGLGKNKRTAEMVGGGALLGTLIGAVAGGGKGAAIGAVGGAAAGAGTQVLTRGKTVKVPAESKLSFQLDQPLRLSAAY
jgi:hypothetical protein